MLPGETASGMVAERFGDALCRVRRCGVDDVALGAAVYRHDRCGDGARSARLDGVLGGTPHMHHEDLAGLLSKVSVGTIVVVLKGNGEIEAVQHRLQCEVGARHEHVGGCRSVGGCRVTPSSVALLARDISAQEPTGRTSRRTN